MSRGVLGPEVQDPAIRCLHMILQVVGVLDVEAEHLVWLHRVGHGSKRARRRDRAGCGAGVDVGSV